MELELSSEAKDKRLNRWAAMTVVAFSVFIGLSQVKDGNIVQAMEQAQSNGVDRWNEYQATRTKLHIDQTALGELAVAAPAASPAAAAERARLGQEIAKYRAEAPRLRAEAEGFQGQYDALNVHDDQFDASDALMAIAVSIAAVATLAESFPALWASWLFGAAGLVMGLAGFLGLGLRSPLAQWLS